MTEDQLKKIAEDLRDELTELAQPGSGHALWHALAMDMLANSRLLLKLLTARIIKAGDE